MKLLIRYTSVLIFIIAVVSCEISSPSAVDHSADSLVTPALYVKDSTPVTEQKSIPENAVDSSIRTGKTTPAELVGYAQTLIGVPYVYGSTNPAVGFDCSGFITYVFNHFNIAVPRSSVDFTGVGETVNVADALQGDLILFTGTNPMEANVGHMGIVISNDTNEGLKFIHATSGKAMSVTISPLSEQYKKRFVRVARIF